MKRTMLILMFAFIAFAAKSVSAQCEIKTINLHGKDYTVCKKLPDEIIGVYK